MAVVFRCSAVALVALMASCAVAQAPLRMKHGMYVAEGTPCADPPNAALLTWDGVGLGGAHASQCTTTAKRMSAHGTFRISTTCNALGDGTPAKPLTQVQMLQLRSDHEFALSSGKEKAEHYRWCAAKP